MDICPGSWEDSVPRTLPGASTELTILSSSRSHRERSQRLLPISLVTLCLVLATTPLKARGVLTLRPGVPDRIGAIAAGDFNADGTIDLLVGNFLAGDVSLFEDDGSGNYVERSPSPFLVLSGPSFIAATAFLTSTATVAQLDLNRDGRTDAVIVDRSGRGVSVRLSDPTLTLKATSNLLVARLPQVAAIADFTSDSRLDLAVTSLSDGLIYIFSGRGDGSFSFLRSIDPRTAGQKTGSTPIGLVGALGGDFNRDGKADLAVTEREANLLAILIGKGNGTFQPPVTLPTGRHPTHLVGARFTEDLSPGPADDFMDLAVLFEGGTQNPSDPPATAVPGGVTSFLGNPDGTFASGATVNLSLADQPVAIAAGDVGLGAPDLDDVVVVNFGSQDVLLFPSDGAGGFDPATPVGQGSPTLRRPSAIALIDRSGDGIVDRLAVANYEGYSFTLFDGGGMTPFTEVLASPVTATRDPVALDLGGLDQGTGDDAAVLCEGDPSLNTFIAVNDGTFFKRRVTPLPAASAPSSLFLADFTSDGALDAAVALSDVDGSGAGTTPGVAILNGSGTGTFGSASGLCTGGGSSGKSCTSNAGCPGGACSFSVSFGVCTGGTNAGKSCAADTDCPSGTCALPPPPVDLAAIAAALLAEDLNPLDADLDGVPNALDNCPSVPNPNHVCSAGTNVGAPCASDSDCPGGGFCRQIDADGDGVGDACDGGGDQDGDGILDESDNCHDTYNPNQADADTDRVGDACEHFLDLVAVERGADRLEVRMGEEAGAFGAPILLPSGNAPAAVVSGNFTGGDGAPDLVVTNHDDGTLQVFPGDGSGAFSPNACTGGQRKGQPCSSGGDCPGGFLCVPFLLTLPGTQPGALAVLEANPDDLDLDGDPNALDNCPTRSNPTQGDVDQDGIGDACSNSCTTGSSQGQACVSAADCPGGVCGVEDPDGDLVVTRVENRLDNCPDLYNLSQADADGDRIGDACDSNPSIYNSSDDQDLDGVLNGVDNCPTRYNPAQTDTSGNGVGDDCDELSDTDGDGIATARRIRDNCPDIYNPPEATCNGRQCDTDFDGIGDACQEAKDLVLADEANAQIWVFVQLSQFPPPASLVPLPPVRVGSDPSGIAVLDLNGDRIDDLAVANRGDSTVSILLGRGDGTFLMTCAGGTAMGKVCLADADCPASSCEAEKVSGVPDPGGIQGGFFHHDGIVQELPEVAAFSRLLNNPIFLINVIIERADIDDSGRVDGRDLATWARGFGLVRADAAYAPALGDVNLDGKIDGLDLTYITSQFGKPIPLSPP